MLTLTGDNFEQKVVTYALIWLKFSDQDFEKMFLFSNFYMSYQKIQNVRVWIKGFESNQNIFSWVFCFAFLFYFAKILKNMCQSENLVIVYNQFL